MRSTASETSLATDNDESSETATNNMSRLPSSTDKEKIYRIEEVFSRMIDQTCSNGPTSDGNIFEHTFTPQNWYGFFFRSIVPSQQTIREHLANDLPPQFFKYNEGEGVNYSFKVLDRRTNRLTYEQMPTYHKYVMRLLFCGPIQRELMNTTAIQEFFASETIRLGKVFDDPKSREHIATFIKMYQINLNELLHSNISDYETFNEFFYRKLKPGARPIDKLDDPNTIVSAADCRLIVFDNVNEATRIWIKGRYFSLKHLFDNRKLAEEFDGGSIAIFRLAPVDYHRYHTPINGKIGSNIRQIPGTYYTVNPIAIREDIDVLTRNRRTVITIESDNFENVVFVAIGATLVGSVNFTVEPGQSVKKGDEVGMIEGF